MSTAVRPVAPTPRPGLVVAVDGTSGSGKSSTCRGVAQQLGLAYLDTGAMFRAITWWLLAQGVDVHDAEAVAARCDEPVLVSGTDPAAPTITVDGDDVGGPIRSAEVNAAVSPVSAVPAVRARLLAEQRAVITAALDGPGIVVEGRDIGSVVWPQAGLKVWLTADVAARAARRTAEEGGSDTTATAASLTARDEIDSGRATAPLLRADGAVHLDTTHHDLDQVVARLVDLARAAGTDRG